MSCFEFLSHMCFFPRFFHYYQFVNLYGKMLLCLSLNIKYTHTNKSLGCKDCLPYVTE